MDSQQHYNNSILVPQTKEAWLTMLRHRAEKTWEINQENLRLMEELEALLAAPLTKESADLLFHETHHMYWDGYDDSQLLLPLLEKLMKYYEQNEDTSRLAFLYSAAYYEESEV